MTKDKNVPAAPGYYWAWFDDGDGVMARPVHLYANGRVGTLEVDGLMEVGEAGIVAFEIGPMTVPEWPPLEPSRR
jgi:hypothetical protein